MEPKDGKAMVPESLNGETPPTNCERSYRSVIGVRHMSFCVKLLTVGIYLATASISLLLTSTVSSVT